MHVHYHCDNPCCYLPAQHPSSACASHGMENEPLNSLLFRRAHSLVANSTRRASILGELTASEPLPFASSLAVLPSLSTPSTTQSFRTWKEPTVEVQINPSTIRCSTARKTRFVHRSDSRRDTRKMHFHCAHSPRSPSIPLASPFWTGPSRVPSTVGNSCLVEGVGRGCDRPRA